MSATDTAPREPTSAPEPNQFPRGLRSLADVLEANPVAQSSYDDYRHVIFAESRERLVEIVRALGGHWQKDENPDTYFGMTRDLGGGVSIYVFTARAQVCEAVKTGTRIVKRPAPDAPMVEVEEDVIEWRCPGSLLEDR